MKGWRVEFDKESLDDLKRLSSPIRRGIIEKIGWLCEHFDDLTPQPLGAAWQGFFKIRVGDYRIIYVINWSLLSLTIVLIDHRSRVYKRKPRRKS